MRARLYRRAATVESLRIESSCTYLSCLALMLAPQIDSKRIFSGCWSACCHETCVPSCLQTLRKRFDKSWTTRGTRKMVSSRIASYSVMQPSHRGLCVHSQRINSVTTSGWRLHILIVPRISCAYKVLACGIPPPPHFVLSEWSA